MTGRRFIVQVGTGIDMHGQDPTNAAKKAVHDAVSRNCLCGLVEILGMRDVNEIEVEVLVAVPQHEDVDHEEVLKAVPIGTKRIQVVSGGLAAECLYVERLGDRSDMMLVANAAVTVRVKGDLGLTERAC